MQSIRLVMPKSWPIVGTVVIRLEENGEYGVAIVGNPQDAAPPLGAAGALRVLADHLDEQRLQVDGS